jgi:hypothetical protein
MKQLHISESFSLPLDFITQTQAILAIKRVGKSYTASVQAEELLKAGQQIVAIDVTGAWWGLRSNAAGNGPGFPILIAGGDHADIPLEVNAGEVMASAIVAERFSAILDLSLFRKGEAQRFLADFFETLYRKNRDAMHLFMDEADFYAPQKPFGEEARVLGAVNDIVRRGGIRGIGSTMITQRPAVLNKDILTMCGILTALRISHPKDLDAVMEWVRVHASPAQAQEMLASLPSLPIGTAWVWASGWPTEEGLLKRIKVRQRETFNSGATPKAGQVAQAPKVIAQVDIAKLGQQIAETAQRVKENDPKELKAAIATLRAENNQLRGDLQVALSDLARVDADLGVRRLEATALREQLDRLEQTPTVDSGKVEELRQTVNNRMLLISNEASARMKALREVTASMEQALTATVADAQSDIERTLGDLVVDGVSFGDRFEMMSRGGLVQKGEPSFVGEHVESYPCPPGFEKHISNAAAGSVTVHVQNNSNGKLGGTAKKMLDVLLQWYPRPMNKGQVAAHVGIKARGGNWTGRLSELSTAGLIEKVGEQLRATEKAKREYGASVARSPRSTREVMELWRARLNGTAFKMLECAVAHRGHPISRELMAQAAGIQAKGGNWTGRLSELRTAGLIVDASGGQVAANKEVLFL